MYEPILLFLLLLAPISILLHEIGHAIGAYLLKADVIQFSIGIGKSIFSIKLGRFNITIHLLFLFGGFIGHERNKQYKKWELVFISILGPLVNIIAAGLCLLIHNELFYISFLFNLWLGIFNLIPFKWKGKKSDGYICLEVLKRG